MIRPQANQQSNHILEKLTSLFATCDLPLTELRDTLRVLSSRYCHLSKILENNRANDTLHIFLTASKRPQRYRDHNDIDIHATETQKWPTTSARELEYICDRSQSRQILTTIAQAQFMIALYSRTLTNLPKVFCPSPNPGTPIRLRARTYIPILCFNTRRFAQQKLARGLKHAQQKPR
jgi:hypothetical protein